MASEITFSDVIREIARETRNLARRNPVDTTFFVLVLLASLTLAFISLDEESWSFLEKKVFTPYNDLLHGAAYAIAGYSALRVLGFVIWLFCTRCEKVHHKKNFENLINGKIKTVIRHNPMNTIILSIALLGMMAMFITMSAFPEDWDSFSQHQITPNQEILEGIGYTLGIYATLRILGLMIAYARGPVEDEEEPVILPHRIYAPEPLSARPVRRKRRKDRAVSKKNVTQPVAAIQNSRLSQAADKKEPQPRDAFEGGGPDEYGHIDDADGEIGPGDEDELEELE